MQKFLIHVSAFIFLIACADRERANPLDPENPDTMGRPTGLRVISVQDTVFLNWDLINLIGLTGYQIYRKADFETDFSPLRFIEGGNNSFNDLDVIFGTEYRYQISALGANFESLRSDSVQIEPGPTFGWASDNFNRQLLQLTHDSRHQIRSVMQFFTITDIEPNPITGDVWVIDVVNSIFGEVIKVSPNGRVILAPISFTQPSDIALDVNSGAIWVADKGDSVVVKLDASGNEIARVEELQIPAHLSVDQRNGACWVADESSNRIARIRSDGTQVFISSVSFNDIRDIGVDSNDGSVWVAERNRVVKINQNGEIVGQLNDTFSFVQKLAVNENSGEIWLLSWNPSKVGKYSKNGEKIFELDGFFEPEDLSINRFDNSCLVADTRNSRLVRISAEGQTTVRFFVQFPIAVAVQN